MNRFTYKLIITASLLFITCFVEGCTKVRYEYVERPVFRDEKNGYIKTTPHGQIKGLVIVLHTVPQELEKMKKFSLPKLAASEGIMTIYAYIGDPVYDLFLSDSTLTTLDDLIHEIIMEHNIPNNKFVIGGGSLGGSFAVKYAEYCAAGRSKTGLLPSSVFAVDPPLDFERWWRSAENILKRNYHRDAVGEAEWTMEAIRNICLVSPHENLEAYHQFSPYCHSAENGGNARFLAKMPIRFYIKSDINWWIENRRKDYYDINSIDIAAMINCLSFWATKTLS